MRHAAGGQALTERIVSTQMRSRAAVVDLKERQPNSREEAEPGAFRAVQFVSVDPVSHRIERAETARCSPVTRAETKKASKEA